jgi:hypothetical protein
MIVAMFGEVYDPRLDYKLIINRQITTRLPLQKQSINTGYFEVTIVDKVTGKFCHERLQFIT